MHIALVGLPGSGKSTIGRQLARLCGVELVDVDAQIEVHLGCSIKDYFASHGEEAFRDVEAQVLAGELRAQTLTYAALTQSLSPAGRRGAKCQRS